MWKKLLAKLAASIRGSRIDAELDDEIRYHVEMEIRSKEAAGTSPEDARRAALVEFGGVEQAREAARDRRTLWIDSCLQDVRYGAGMLRRNPGFTAVAVLTLGLGIGANTAIFSVVNSLILRPLPVRHAERLAVVAVSHGEGALPGRMSWLDIQDYRAGAGAFEDLAYYTPEFVGLDPDRGAERVLVLYVSGNYFSMLGLEPALGRLILPVEGQVEGADPVVVLGHAYWKSRFGGDPSIVGRVVRVNGHPVTIVGIAPQRFHGTYTFVEVQAYLPLGLIARDPANATALRNRGDDDNLVLGLLRPGVSLEQARASLDVVTRQLAAQYPATHKDRRTHVFWETHARPEPSAAGMLGMIVSVFLGLVLLVLLVVSVNVANLLLVRATARTRELTIRAAVGAGRLRIVRQLLTESLLLSLVGGLAGGLLGWWASGLLATIKLPSDMPARLDFGFDWRVLAYTAGGVLLSALAAGTVPALAVSRGNLADALSQSGRAQLSGAGRHRLRDLLVVAQIAGSLMLLVAAGLFVRSLAAAQRVELGFQPDQVMNFVMDPGQLGYDEVRTKVLYRDLAARVRALAGVESASLAHVIPFGYWNTSREVLAEGQAPGPESRGLGSRYNIVDADYQQTMGVRLVGGRWFTRADEEAQIAVAVVNEVMARRLWPGQEPIGKRFHYRDDQGTSFEVIGVTSTGKYGYIFEDPRPFFYVTHGQEFMSLRVLQVRSAGPPEALVPAVRAVVRQLARDVPVYDVVTMREALDGGNGFFLVRMAASFATTLGLLGVALAVVGLYGVVSYSASRRTHEIGIRMALGAGRPAIVWLVVAHGLGMVGIGAVAGLVAALALGHVLASMLYNVTPYDPLTYAGVSLALAVVALVACYVPARRATCVDPTVALRCE